MYRQKEGCWGALHSLGAHLRCSGSLCARCAYLGAVMLTKDELAAAKSATYYGDQWFYDEGAETDP